ncbi:MAG: hypothetical protein ACR2NN_00040 [Bryobacteraceae bacterium]
MRLSLTIPVILGYGSLASASLLVPNQFHATLQGFATYADSNVTLTDPSGLTIGNSEVFATITPATLEAGLSWGVRNTSDTVYHPPDRSSTRVALLILKRARGHGPRLQSCWRSLNDRVGPAASGKYNLS